MSWEEKNKNDTLYFKTILMKTLASMNYLELTDSE